MTYDPASTPSEIQCRCGHTKDKPIVAPRSKYSIFGWIMLGIGISTCPLQVELYCPVCNHLFETITDPKRCETYRYQ